MSSFIHAKRPFNFILFYSVTLRACSIIFLAIERFVIRAECVIMKCLTPDYIWLAKLFNSHVLLTPNFIYETSNFFSEMQSLVVRQNLAGGSEEHTASIFRVEQWENLTRKQRIVCQNIIFFHVSAVTCFNLSVANLSLFHLSSCFVIKLWV
jgi:hypothetical protein